MLARLDDVPGVAQSYVDWTGRWFLLDLEPRSDEAAVERAAIAALSARARAATGEEERDAIGSRRRGDAWMRAGETLRLSRHEAGVLAGRFAHEAAVELRWDESTERRMAGLFETELVRAFDEVHASGGDDLDAALGRARARIVVASEAVIGAAGRADLARWLATRFGDAR